MACGCRSPPGAPNGIANLPRRIASAGFGVNRGRLPGATDDGWPGTAHDCEPRVDGTKPRPGMTGPSHDESLGVAEHTLPWRSTTQTYDVSPPPVTGLPVAADSGEGCTAPFVRAPSTIPAGGMSGHARSERIARRRSSAYAGESSASIGTGTTRGSP